MNCKEIVGKDQFEKARDEGFLLSLSNDHNGKNCPVGKQLIKCNMKTVVTMSWGPIGERTSFSTIQNFPILSLQDFTIETYFFNFSQQKSNSSSFLNSVNETYSKA